MAGTSHDSVRVHPMPPIHTAAINGDADALRRELESGVLPDTPDQFGFLPLHLVVSNEISGDTVERDNRVACVHLLAAAGANMSATCNPDDMTALMYAAAEDHPTLVATLLDYGSDANQSDDTNWTPLHYAVFSDRGADCMRFLINAGATVDARCNAGRTPLDLSIDECQREVYRGDTACAKRRRRLYPILIRAGAALPAETDDVDSESDDTYTYIRKLRAAGSFQNYERAHLNAIVASFAPKFSRRLPPELVRRVAEYAFHVGDY